jgi:hypothetical protein
MEFRSIFRIWLGATAAFLFVSSCVVALLVYWQVSEVNETNLASHRNLIKSNLVSESTKIADDMYLGLDTLGIREKHYQALLGDFATIKFTLEKSDASPQRAPTTAEWQINNSDLSDRLVVPLYFGDRNLGDLKVVLKWQRSSINRLLWSRLPYIMLAIIFLTAVWVFGFYLLSRKILIPLLQRNADLGRSEAIAKMTGMLAHDVRVRHEVALKAVHSRMASEPPMLLGEPTGLNKEQPGQCNKAFMTRVQSRKATDLLAA